MEKFYTDNNKKNLFITLVIFLTIILLTAIFSILVLDIDFDDEIESQVDKTDIITTNEKIPMNEVSELKNIVEQGPLDENKNKKYNDNNEDEFIFLINKKITFKNSSSLGNVKIENPSTNKYNFYVTIKLKDNNNLTNNNSDEDIIYKSPILEPNQHITNDYLIKKLKKGSHKAIATIFVIDPETEEELAQNQLQIEIRIKN